MAMIQKHTLNCADIRECLPFLSLLFDRNKIGIMVTDAEGRLVYFNDAQEQLDGLSRENVLGRKLYEVYNFTPEDSPGMRVLRTETAVINGCHYYLTRHGKLVNASCDIYPIHSEEGRLLGAICYVQGYSTIVTHLQNIQPHLPDQKRPPKADPAGDGPEEHYAFSSLIGRSPGFEEAIEMARMAAQSRSPVMLVGETGVGKEIFAQAIHYGSSRSHHAYTAINCSAVPETLLEGILFGTTKGAFTGAVNKAGLFEVSDRGTLFLDELDSMPISLQSKLLRVLQENRVRRVGDVRERKIDLKIISSVRSDPLELTETGALRADFYYRLGVVRVKIPPLRERRDDLGLLIDHFLDKHSAELSLPRPELDEGLRSMLYAHNWPGNVRELEHALEAMLNIAPGGKLELVHLMRACPELARVERPDKEARPWRGYQEPAEKPMVAASRNDASGGGSLVSRQKHNEIESISKALKASSGNRSLAARLLGISPQSLYYKIKKYRLSVADYVPVDI